MSFNEEQKEALFYLYKLFYSLLITSDYYATMEFLRGKQSVPEVSFLNNEIKNRINQEFYKEKVVGSKKYNFNKKLKDERYLSNLENSDIKDIEEIGSLRNKILIEADKKLNQVLSSNPEKRVFYLNVPTGGGKTNISMKLALSILMGTVVLLMHVHYTIDVLSAFFITFGTFKIGEWFFSKVDIYFKK